MNQHRFFAAPDEIYEMVRTALDSAWSLPNDKGTHTCMRPLSDDPPRDSQGRVIVSVQSDWCEWQPASEMLPQLLLSGAIEEIDAATYLQELPQIPVQ
jgi:hypothetical protein